ncbi:beta-mannosidase [Sphingomonas sp. ERG5]|uniref:beta-mannosidase n=1 Tax=Sphingomonas sp. ERG5 TaxID=1381597 RepID=UPI000A436745|nr:glycoside hydrolase family 2 protein [Sphingomonas sp. ERG5]
MTLDNWMMLDCDPGAGDPAHLPDTGWLPVPAPGDTYLALHAAGRIPHPFADENEAACAWVKDREWWWRTQFDAVPPAAGERVVLTFDGLDTFARIWLNGVEIGESANMFLAASFDVGAHLRDGGNELLVRFTPPALVVADKQMDTWAIIADPIKESKRNFIRKAQFGWGWDWGPRLPTIGLWRPVRLERQWVAAIENVRFETLAIGDVARVAVTVTVDAFAGAPVNASVTLRTPAGETMASATIDPSRDGRVEFDIADPQLWWTPELGDPTLYDLCVTLIADGREVDRDQRKVGIRTITLDQSPDPDEPGCTFFRFILNDVPIFARGVNWVPASSFVGAITESDYADLLERAAGANMNMVRVWGGGIYEHDAFYDQCDRLGLLVWQDFMFACAPYPEHEPDFVQSVRDEVAYQVTRLRSHACLALWCGNNEGDAVQAFMNRMTGLDTPFLGDLYIHDIMPKTLAALDPATPYWPGSPHGGPSHNSMRGGDVHNWTVWHGLPPTPDDVPVGTFDHSPEAVAYTRYAEDMSRFVSEFGIQAAPARATFARWMKPEAMGLGGAGFLNRVKDHPQDKVNAMLIPVTGLPDTLARYVDFTQIVQAEGMTFGIEHYRRRRPHCSGTLIWQYNDCWPGVSWSLIDGDGVAKPSWYAVRRAYAPVALSFQTLDDGLVELWVVNDTREPVEIDATIDFVTLDGASLTREDVKLFAPANAAEAIWSGRPEGAADRILLVRSRQVEGNRLFFVPIKDIPFAGRPEARIGAIDANTLEVTVSATRYAYGVMLYAEDAATRFSVNGFDLAGGESRTVLVSNARRPIAVGDVTVRSILQV